jgi:hypothetical protein
MGESGSSLMAFQERMARRLPDRDGATPAEAGGRSPEILERSLLAETPEPGARNLENSFKLQKT